MLMNNLSSDGVHKTLQERFCGSELVERLYSQIICLASINILLSITAFMGNTLILVALYKDSSLQLASKFLFRNLAITDLCVGGILQPLNVTYWISVLKERWDICRFTLDSSFIASFILCSVSLLTTTTIGVDRLLIVSLGLRYRQGVRLKRTYEINVACFWVISTVASTMYFWNYNITLWFSYIGLSVCLIISIVSYTKIFVFLHQQKLQISVHENRWNQANPVGNVARYRKAVSTALWLQFTLVVCYLPYGILANFWNSNLFMFSARYFAVTLVYLNSSLNPLLYCWKIREVRQAVKSTIRQLLCSWE